MKNTIIYFLFPLVYLCILTRVSFAQHPFPPDLFPVKVHGTILEINDCSGRRFFLAGMVDNIPNTGLQLSMYDHDEMENQFLYHKAIGANAMRWNAFLRSKKLKWDANGYVTGLSDNPVVNLKDGCDLAYKHGMVLQIVLSTAHWLRYGAGGETPENVTRVNNNPFGHGSWPGENWYSKTTRKISKRCINIQKPKPAIRINIKTITERFFNIQNR